MRRIAVLSAALIGLILALLIGLNYHVHTDLRDASLREVLGELERQALIQAQDIETSLDSLRFVLEKVGMLHQLGSSDPRTMHDRLRQLESQLPYVRALAITDARGRLLHTSRNFPAPNLDLSDRPNIAVHLLGRDNDLHFSGPDLNKTDRRWQLAMSLAIRDDAGHLVGVASSVIDPYTYAETFAKSAPEGDYVTLVDRDFRIVARSPWYEDGVGKELKAAAYSAFEAEGRRPISGVYSNPFTGEMRVTAVRALFDGRLVLSSSRPLSRAIANWRSLAIIIGVTSGALVLICLAAVLIVVRMLQNREKTSQNLIRLNHELLEQTDRAERLAAVKSEFLATMSHEIRTPMNGVLGMAQALEALPLEARVRDYVGVIRESAENLLAVINDILDFSRLEAGKLRISPSAIRLTGIMESMTGLFLPACTQKGLALKTEIAPGTPPFIESDPARLRQILVNLTGNAVKFTSRGHIVLRARPASHDGVACIRFEVEDSGPGISPQARDRIFDRFAQEDASTSRQFGGTGLGLAICKRLCELLGGRIGCRSEKGHGSLFWIELPHQMPDETTEETTFAETPSVAATAEPRVLCVDDNAVNRKVVDTLLRPFCRTLVMAGSGAEALQLATAQPFDVVLLDIHMPGMDGLEVHRRLRSTPAGQKLRIVALTADVVPEALARYEMAGFDGVVAKPIEMEKLLEAIRMV